MNSRPSSFSLLGNNSSSTIYPPTDSSTLFLFSPLWIWFLFCHRWNNCERAFSVFLFYFVWLIFRGLFDGRSYLKWTFFWFNSKTYWTTAYYKLQAGGNLLIVGVSSLYSLLGFFDKTRWRIEMKLPLFTSCCFFLATLLFLLLF